MSNEELAAQIQQGNTGLLETLWDNVHLLVRRIAGQYYRATGGRGGLEIEDLEQIGFLAMVDSVGTYTSTKEAKFTTWLCIHLRKYFQEASGRLYKDNKGLNMPKDALNTSISLNKSVDDDEETELMEITADPGMDWDAIENSIWREQLRDVVADVLQELPEDQASVIRCRFWDNLTYEGTAGQLGRNAGEVRGAESKAIRALRQSKHRKRLYPFFDFDYYSGASLGAFKSTGASIQERYVMKQEKISKNMF